MNECCQDERNLVVTERLEMDLVVRVCSVCHKRHFEFFADIGEVFGKDEVDNG